MSLNYWNVTCAICGQGLRLSFSDEKLGKTVDAICPLCHNKTRTTIGTLYEDIRCTESIGKCSDLPIEIEQAASSIAQRIKGDLEIRELCKKITKAGYIVEFGVGISQLLDKKTSDAQPLVDSEGNVKPGTFSAEDERKFQKAFRIKL